MNALDVIGLTKAFGGVTAVDSVDLTVAEGTIHSVIGANGAGKTTLINLITGIYVPDSGQVRIFGTDVTGLAPERLVSHGMGRTFQNLQIFTEMSVVDNVLVGAHQRLNTNFLAGILNLPSVRRTQNAMLDTAHELLELVGISDVKDAEASQLSYGHLKRLEIARALAAEPRFLLLDEPAAGLNASETANLARVIQRLAEQGVSILLVEHDMSLVMSISDRITVLNQGTVLTEGKPADVRADSRVIAAYLGEVT